MSLFSISCTHSREFVSGCRSAKREEGSGLSKPRRGVCERPFEGF